ncbi:MoaD/ThiS family protein [Croceicoccus ponticola]|uniref:MoaD/ThiS family protein n=1 Tax=Croceicoccus ponticola TaxID=2217664 RepID=A0A437H1P6_9SPHN|nr:MoaD/ThiS family protein [Croceicoccus ponticola]RVQ69561.1 MoaD/ThiS family protein [Croceicoccus ponticola]
MALLLLFLGPLEDVAGAGEIALDVAEPLTLAAIAERLEPELAVALVGAKIRMALNGNLVAPGEVMAGDGDELAFLPPVSGG